MSFLLPSFCETFMLIKYTYVDVMTRRPVNEEPAVNGPTFPDINDLEYKWGNESEWPCSFPTFYGICADDTDPITPGILEVVTQEAFDAALAKEMGARVERHKTEARGRRGMLLFQSDWTQLADAPLSNEQKLKWTEYRQALRDIPQQEGFPQAIEWPTAPDAPTPLATAA